MLLEIGIKFGDRINGKNLARDLMPSFEAGLNYSSSAVETDRKAGESIFHQRCAGCHGAGGTGGPGAPSLTRREYTHGDSDFGILEVLRHGIPGTEMPKADLPIRELLQVIAYIKMLQAHVAEDQKPGASHPAI
jgi:mono/diheme cytochrome c family protein